MTDIQEALGEVAAPTPIQASALAYSAPVVVQSASALSKPLIVFGAIVGAAVLIVGGWLAFAFYSSPAPMTILQRAIQNSLNVKTFTFTATSTGSFSASDVSQFASVGSSLSTSEDFTGVTHGSVDISSLTQPLIDVTTEGNIAIRAATSTGSVVVAARTIYLDKELYVDLSNFNLTFSSSDPKLAMTQFFVALANGFAGSLKDKWIKIDTASTSSSADTKSSPSLATDLSKLRDYVASLSYITSIQNIGIEGLGGIDTYHLKVQIQNGQSLIDLVRKLILDIQPTAKDSPGFDQQMADLSKAITQKVDVELWIGKSDFRVYKILIAPVTVVSAQAGATSTLGQEVSFGNYDQPVSIVAPQGAMPLEQIIASMFGGSVKLSH